MVCESRGWPGEPVTHKKWILLAEGAVGEVSRPATGSGARDSHRDSQSQHMIRDSQLRQDRCLLLRGQVSAVETCKSCFMFHLSL